MPSPPPSRRFLLLYALAWAGLFVSFMPFITILLPMKVEAVVAGADARVGLLSAAALGGAAVASVANILFGALSDITHRRRGTRRPWAVAGLATLLLAYAAFRWSDSPAALLGAVALLQIAINMMFAPLAAVMADEVPHARKGLVSGLLGAAQPMGSLAAVLITLPGLGDETSRYALLCALIAAMVAPFLLLAREHGAGIADLPDAPAPRRLRRIDLTRVWSARMLVQIAGNALTTYGFFYFQQVTDTPQPHEWLARRIAWVTAAATLAAVLLTLGAGRLSDRLMRRKPFLGGAALMMAAGMALMATAHDWWPAALGYGAALSGQSIFLALQSALAMQLLGATGNRGRDLGFFNLTNTLPAMIAPLVALELAALHAGLRVLMLVLAAGCLAGGALALRVRTEA